MPTRRGNITTAPTALESTRRVNVNILQPELNQFKMLCDAQDRDVSDVIRAFVKKCIEEGKLNA